MIIGVSWGSLPAEGQQEWTRLSCDAVLRGERPPPRQAWFQPPVQREYTPDPAFAREYNRRLDTALAERRVTPSRRLRKAASPESLVVAVCASTTSRGLRNISRLDQLTLFNIMVPSLVQTLLATPARDVDAASGGTGLPFELWIYIAFDSGDAFYDNPRQEAAIGLWLDEKVVRPLAARGIVARHCMLRFSNVMRKPGPSFNFMMAAAAEDGADYLYRINDDTQFVDVWLPVALHTLRTFDPPNVGVVGPTCREGNTKILTHDLVHRTHLAIFEHYYPPVLSDWWMDDWITRVYSASTLASSLGVDRQRMSRAPFLVRHRVDIHGTRYQVDHSHETALVGELAIGLRTLGSWLQARAGASKATLSG